MRFAEARATLEKENGLDSLLEELWRLSKTVSPEKYFGVLDEFVDNARETLEEIPDPAKREEMREQYRRVIEWAVDLARGQNA